MNASEYPTTKYRMTFERIGRDHNITAVLPAYDADDLAERIGGLARAHLGSRDFTVTVDLEAMTGTIEGGRFGRFTIEVAS